MLIKKYALQEGITEAQAEEMLKNTAPRKGLIEFFKYVVEKHKTVIVDGKVKQINLCDRKKATSLFEYITHGGLAICTDDNFEQGRARKFQLSARVSQIRDSWNSNNIRQPNTAVA